VLPQQNKRHPVRFFIPRILSRCIRSIVVVIVVVVLSVAAYLRVVVLFLCFIEAKHHPVCEAN
jgi:hypothetical protein